MLNYLAAYGATALAFLALDVVWLGFIAKSFYRDGIGHLMADTPNLVAGGVFYLLYPAGVLLFALAPAAWSSQSSSTRRTSCLLVSNPNASSEPM